MLSALKTVPAQWSDRFYHGQRIGLFRVVMLYGLARLICHMWPSPTVPGIASFLLMIIIAAAAEVFLRVRPDLPGELSCLAALVLQLLDVLGSGTSSEAPLALSWLARSHMLWSLCTPAFGWRPIFAGAYLLTVLVSHTTLLGSLLQQEAFSSWVLRDHLIGFFFFALASFAAVLHWNALMRQIYWAERRAALEAQAWGELIALTCDFDLVVGSVEDQVKQDTILRVLEPTAKSLNILGRALEAGEALQSFLSDEPKALSKSLAEAKELEGFLLPTRLQGPAQEEVQVHFLVVRKPRVDADTSIPLPKGQTLVASYLVGVRIDHAQDPPSELLPPPAEPMLHRAYSNGSNCLSVAETTVTGALFSTVELNGTGLGSLLEVGLKEHWLIPPENLQLHCTKLLGSGGFGLVCEGTFCGATVALKFPRKGIKDCKFPTCESREYILFMNYISELRLLRHVRHPNIVSFFGAAVDPTSLELMLVFEKMTGKTLTKFIPVATPRENERLQILLDMAKALVYLHGLQPAVVHGDLKSDNIFVEERKDCLVTKLGDFGLARRATKSAAGMGGTLRWCAPEVLQGSWSPSTAADAYSYGQVAFFVISGRMPLSELKRHEMTEALSRGQLPPEDWPTGFMTRVRAIAESCRRFEPQERPPVLQIWRDLCNIQAFDDTGPSPGIIGRSAISRSPSASSQGVEHPFAAPLPALPLLEPPPLDLPVSHSMMQSPSSRDLEVQMEMARKHAFGRSPYF